MNEEIINVGIYVRVSTEEQAREGYSIRAQIEKLSDYARIMNWNVYSVYSDAGLSGKNITDRPDIKRMIQDLIEKRINAVLVFKIDRLTRSTKDLIELVEVFNNNNCSFVSLMESIDTKSASGRMFLKIIGIFAEFERENIIERVSAGFERKVKEGYSLCSYIPSFGYEREIGEKIQHIKEDEAIIVREIFDMFVNQGLSAHAIATSLNVRGIKSKRGSIFNTKTINLILKNPNYVARVRYSVKNPERYFEAEGKHEPIIDIETFEKAQIKLGKIPTKIRTKHAKSENFFVGTLYCAECGRKLSSHRTYRELADGTVNVIPSYRCVNKMWKVCTAKDMSQKKVEEAFIEYLDNIEDLKITEDLDLEKQQENELKMSKQKEVLEKRLSKLQSKEKDVMKLYINEKINFDEYSEMNKIVLTEKQNVIEELQIYKVEETEEEIFLSEEDIITNIKENWLLLNNDEKLEFLLNYIKRIDIINEPVDGKLYGKVKIKKVEFYKK